MKNIYTKLRPVIDYIVIIRKSWNLERILRYFSTNGHCTCSLREGGITSKIQQHDDTIILDSSSRPWLVSLVNLIVMTRKRDEKLFSFTIDTSRKELRAATQSLQVGILDITSYVIRHSGIEERQSVTLQVNRRSPEAGRWLSSTFLRRYEMSARLSRLVVDLPTQVLVKIQETRKVSTNLMSANLNERFLKRVSSKPLQRDVVTVRTSQDSKVARSWC